MIRLVACDIDGTLLHGRETELKSEVINEIWRLKEKGILFCAASGRQYTSLHRLFREVSNDIYYICENGAIIFGPGNPGRILTKTEIPRDKAEALCHEILSREDCEILISGANMSYLCPKKTEIVELIRDFTGNQITIVNSPEEVPEPIVKISAYCRDSAVSIDKPLGDKWRNYFNVAVAGVPWLDFTLEDKGSAIRHLCQMLDIPLEDVMAIGDNYNDVPMLRIVGEAVLMENAVAELKQQFLRHCFRVTDVLRTL